MTPAVELSGVGLRYGEDVVLAPTDLSIAEGRFVVLLGPSGSGKTTLLSIVGGFLSPSRGSVRIFGADVTRMPAARRPTATVFQDYALFPHMSVEANVAFGPRMRGRGRAAAREQAVRMLDIVGLSGFASRRVHELSGGQRQRVALARALAVEPSVLLLDEPLGALDLALRRQMQEELKSIQRRLGATFIHVTHDQEEAMTMGDEIVLMSRGRIEDSGPPDRIYRRPRTEFSARFMGESNIIGGTVMEHHGGAMLVETAFGRLAVAGRSGLGTTVTLCLRPERVMPHRPDKGMVRLGTARIIETVFHGTHYRARAAIGSADMLLHLPPDSPLGPGAEVTIGTAPDDLVVLGRPAHAD